MAEEEKGELKERVAEARARLEALSGEVAALVAARRQASPLSPKKSAGDGDDVDCTLVNLQRVKARRKLVGHFGKVVSMTFARDSERAMTASQDGNVILWNAITSKKANLIPLKSSWVMFAEMTQSGPDMFATGGLDNVATVWKSVPGASGEQTFKVEQEFYGHDGYVCSARFMTGDKLLTTSGDGTAGLWDLKKSKAYGDKDGDDRVSVFRGHTKDVTSVDLKPDSRDDFLTSSTDGTCMIWNVNHDRPTASLRLPAQSTAQSTQQQQPSDDDEDTGDAPKAPQLLLDVNKAKFMSNGWCVGCATESFGSFLFDVRARGAVNTFDSTATVKDNNAKYSLAFSKTGRLMFVACENATVEVWDTLLPDQPSPLYSLANVHQNRVSDVAVPPNGFCVGASSWDTNCSIAAA